MKTKSAKNNLIIFLAISALPLLGVKMVKANERLVESQIINYVNQERVSNSLEQLTENDILNEVANLKAQDMLGNDYFAHTSPIGIDPWYWFDKVGYSYKYAGENLGMDFETSSAVHEAWMNSETHRENILSPKYDEIGVAVKRGIINNKETQIAVQVFGKSLIDSELIIPVMSNETEDSGILEKNDVLITQSSIHFWKGVDEDEMLVSAEIEGNPQEVLVDIGSEEYVLEKLREGVYINLISIKDIDIKNENVLIKAIDDQEKAIFSKVPDKYFAEYLVEKEDQDVKDSQVAMILALDRNNNNNLLERVRLWFNQTGFMLLIVGLFIITIFNIWILEREEERLLEIKT